MCQSPPNPLQNPDFVFQDRNQISRPAKINSVSITSEKNQLKTAPLYYLATTQAPLGYGGPIDLLIGFEIKKNHTKSFVRLHGVRVIPPHKETPGLGDKILPEYSDWILSFEQQQIKIDTPAWKVKPDGGEFDAFTGATMTPRAIVEHLYDFLNAVLQNPAPFIATPLEGIQ